MKLENADKQQFVQEVRSLGMEAFFLAPSAFEEYVGNSRGIGTNPFEQLPSVRCIIALVTGYSPFQSTFLPHLSAYYIASNRGYKAAGTLSEKLKARGAEVVMADLPVRAVLEKAKVASVGQNGLAAMQKNGSFFYAKLLLSDAFEPEESVDTCLPCVRCGRCEKACPVGAIGETFNPSRCIREHLDGRIIPENVKRAMVSLLGCDLCQRACPRNASIPVLPPGKEIEELFCFENLILQNKKTDIAKVVGKNMVGGGRLQAQALVLAAKAGYDTFTQAAQQLCTSERDCLSDAAHWYLQHSSH